MGHKKLPTDAPEVVCSSYNWVEALSNQTADSNIKHQKIIDKNFSESWTKAKEIV